jgi:adenosylhomocysteine nucleosidase
MEKLNLTANPIFLVALEVELPPSGFPNLNIQYTGVGKVNAAYHTMKSIQTYKPTMVINFGSAGAVRSDISGLVQVSRVIQRDMDVQGLGFELGQTPFEIGEDSFELEDCSKIDNNRDGIKVSCSTGDNFVSEEPKLTSDIVDMELYAIAKICSRESVPLFSWKYISDQADGNSPKDWESNVSRGVEAFKNIVLSQFT